MPSYAVSGTTPAPAAAAPYATFHTSAARRARIREIGMFTQTATYSGVGLIRPANTPAATTSIVPVPHVPEDAAPVCTLDTAWAVTPPTIGAGVFMRKVDLGPAIGSGVIWKLALDERIELEKLNAAAGWLVWWNYGAAIASALDLYVEYDE